MMSGTMILMLKKSADRRQREALEEAFKRADINGDGKLSVDEYSRIFTEHGVAITRDEIEHMINLADKDQDGFISKEEFLGEEGETPPTRSRSSSTSQSKAELAFNVYDKNHDGYVTQSEMLKTSKCLTKSQVQAVLTKYDENKDGKLDKSEFKEFMNKSKK